MKCKSLRQNIVNKTTYAIGALILNHIYTSHDNMTICPYGLVIFATNHKNVVVITTTYDYVVHDYSLNTTTKCGCS